MPWSRWYDYNGKSISSNAPSSMGVYELGDSSENTLYYGSGNIRTRLNDHLNKRECPRASYFRFEQISSGDAARRKEEKLLEEYKKIHGKYPMYNERMG